jgi:hypothetical protein
MGKISFKNYLYLLSFSIYASSSEGIQRSQSIFGLLHITGTYAIETKANNFINGHVIE